MNAVTPFKSAGKSRHSSNNPGTLMHHAEMAQGPLMLFTRALAEYLELNPDTQVIKGPLKLKERFLAKAAKYNGKFSEVPDLVRNRISFKAPETIFMLRSITGPGKNTNEFLQEWENRGIRITEIDDAFLDRKKSGCVNVALSVEINLGKGRWHTCEIQFTHEAMDKIDADTRYNYDTYIRPVTDLAKAEDRELTAEESDSIVCFQEANKAMYDGGIIANGLARLLSKSEFKALMDRISLTRQSSTKANGPNLRIA